MPDPVVYECWAHCRTCALDLPRSPYLSDTHGHTEHESVGLVAGSSAAHLAAHPNHDVTYRRERAEQADERRAEDAEIERTQHAAMSSALIEQLEQRRERLIAEQRLGELRARRMR